MAKPEATIKLIEQAIQNPANQAVETGRVSSFEVSIARLRFVEKVRLFIGPTEPLLPEEELLNQFMDRFDPNMILDHRSFFGGAITHRGQRYWNELSLGNLSTTQRLPGEALLEQGITVKLKDPDKMARYAMSPLTLESLPLTTEQQLIVHFYPNARIAGAVADYHRSIQSGRASSFRDSLLEELTYKFPADLVRQLDTGQPLDLAIKELYPD